LSFIIKTEFRRIWENKMAVSATEKNSASGVKKSLQDKTENASSNARNVFGVSETRGRVA
jgi:hypothetical protein